MHDQISNLITKLEHQLQFYRRQQSLSRDEKKSCFWLGKANATAEDIVHLKTILQQFSSK